MPLVLLGAAGAAGAAAALLLPDSTDRAVPTSANDAERYLTPTSTHYIIHFNIFTFQPNP